MVKKKVLLHEHRACHTSIVVLWRAGYSCPLCGVPLFSPRNNPYLVWWEGVPLSCPVRLSLPSWPDWNTHPSPEKTRSTIPMWTDRQLWKYSLLSLFFGMWAVINYFLATKLRMTHLSYEKHVSKQQSGLLTSDLVCVWKLINQKLSDQTWFWVLISTEMVRCTGKIHAVEFWKKCHLFFGHSLRDFGHAVSLTHVAPS